MRNHHWFWQLLGGKQVISYYLNQRWSNSVTFLCDTRGWSIHHSGGCFTNVVQALENNLVKIRNARNHIYDENFKLKLCRCAQSMDLGTCTKFQLGILIRSTISATHTFHENILESSRNVNATNPWCWGQNAKAIPWQIMAWPHASPSHQQPQHWLYRKMVSFPPRGRNWTTSHLNMEK